MTPPFRPGYFLSSARCPLHFSFKGRDRLDSQLELTPRWIYERSDAMESDPYE